MSLAATLGSRARSLFPGLALTFLAVVLAAPASAQVPATTKTPTGPWVTQNPSTGAWQVNAGETITWEIRLINPTPGPTVVSFIDTPQSAECEPGGRSDPWGQTGNTSETAPQTGLYMDDVDGDGDCEEAVIEAPAGATVTCDTARQRLEVRNIALAPFGTALIRFETVVDPSVADGQVVCNWGHVLDGGGGLLMDTQDPNNIVPGCTCVNLLPPNELDFDLEKSVVFDNAPPLIPDDPTSTVLYTITLRNTGGEDIRGGNFNDDLFAAANIGLEWVEIVDCPAPLRCTLTPPNLLNVTGWQLTAGLDPPAEQSVQARARVTCEAATDDNTGQICNQGSFTYSMGTFATDDPSLPGSQDPTCSPVAFSNLTASAKFVDGFDDANGNGQLDRGERVNFLIRATNTGQLTARDVRITDDISVSTCFDLATIVALDGGVEAGGLITWNIGDLAANPSLPPTVDVRFSVVLSADVPTCCNQAFIQSAERMECGLVEPIPTDDPSTPLPGDPTCVTPGPQPILSATKVWTQDAVQDANANGRPDVGEDLTWTVVIENTGSGPATAAEFRDPMPVCHRNFDGLPLVATTAADGDWGDNASIPYAGLPQPGVVIIERLGGDDGIQPGEQITITFIVRIVQVVGCCNQGAITYAQAVTPKLTDDPATLGQPDDESCLIGSATEAAELEKTRQLIDDNGDGFFCVGETIRYTMVFSNVGNVDLSNVVIDDLSSACLAIDTSTVVITPPAAATDTSGGTAVQIQIASISPGTANDVTIEFEASALVEGVCDNQATWVADELPMGGLSDVNTANAAPEEPTRHQVTCPPVADVQLSLAKDASPTGCLDPGTTVTFTLTVTNIGADPVSTFALEDLVPAGLLNVTPVTPGLLYDAGANRVFIDDGGALAPTAFADFVYTADTPCTLAGSVTNQAALTYSDGVDDHTVMATADVSWGAADLSATSKAMGWADDNANGHVDGAEVVTFTIDVCNDAAAGCDARDVLVSDQLDARFDLASVVVSSGGMLVGDTITWDRVSTPALGAIAPGNCVTLTFDVQVDAATPQPVAIPNQLTAEALGNSTAACPVGSLPDPVQLVDADQDVPWGEQVVAGQVDLLRNAAVTSRAAALSEIRTVVFDAPWANSGTCGETRLATPRDLEQADVGLSIDTGLTVVGDADAGGAALVFYEASELCGPEDGGTDDRLCVRKSGSDVIIATSPDPATCP